MSEVATAWSQILTAALPEVEHLARAMADPRGAQTALLRSIITANRDTSFGRDHDFARIRDPDDYRRAVPTRSHEDLYPWIDAVVLGQEAVLTSEPVIAFEETGGTTSGSKLIPYTAASLGAFRAAVLPWLADLARRRPVIAQGRAYVSISPALRAPRRTECGIPIGLPSEGAYLGADAAAAFLHILAVPHHVAAIDDVGQWQTETLAALVGAPDLTFVSIWSPTFLDPLLDALEAGAEGVLRHLRDSPDWHRREAAARLEAALATGRLDARVLWPRLDTVSCWADGASQPYARRLATRLAHAAVEPKGLLATEAAVTIPWGGARGGVPALTSTFIELIGDDGRARLVDEAEPGVGYRVVVTTPGGLYRYDLGDRVRCITITDGVPRLAFEGRAGSVGDMVGEKLNEAFVAAALASSVPHPATLVPDPGPPAGYVLLVDAPVPDSDGPPSFLCDLELRLGANPQYAYARAMGQLSALAVQYRPGYFERHVRRAVSHGRRLGDVKPVALMPRFSLVDWE